MISINGLSFSFGAQTIFDDTSLTIDDCKNGLVGRNGSGKSTFFNLISGNLTPEYGNISISNSGKIAYLKQAMAFDDVDMLPHEFVLSNIAFYNNYNALMEKLENTESPDLELLHEFSEVESVFNNHNGYKLKEDVIQVLESLGFKKEAKKRIFELSYGFKMRLFLAKLLLDESEILLLDEPTNHLDLPSIKFVEEYLKRINKLCIIVSHDRAFLDSVCERTLELNNKKIKKYNGNYTFYKNQREAAIIQTEKERENLMEEKARLEEMIARIKDNVKKVNIASSRQKFVDKIDDKLENLEDFSKKEVSFMRRDEVLRSDIGFRVKIKEKSYDKQKILEDIEIAIRPTDRIFLIGANGYGKSTLLRIIASRDTNFIGEVKENEKLKLLYFDFDKIAQLKDETTVLDFIYTDGVDNFRAKQLLGMMLFTDDDYEKKIKVLSGGERVRLYLTKLFCSTFNFVILDEPTNYLDIETVDVFIDWLRGLKSGFIIVTHNEYLLKTLENVNVWRIEDRQLKKHFGNYNDYKFFENKYQQEEKKKEETKKAEKAKPHDARRERQILIEKRSSINKQLKSLEKEIELLETEKKDLYAKMTAEDSYKMGPELKKISERVKQIERMLKTMYDKWNKLIDEMPELGDE
ncbi:TPA: hypothetical protein DCW38_02910 [candidate division WOR-3 bacterium]|jgi:ATP-binding cassette subfamily F protein 3|uniref:ABC transporter domain-containing protein n=1 Tax=candidate division WOR-3 bacterium TaxID=2052148 RepID=A0A350H997_UNCW3|nr:hypothetical protein [candidate division WOR-3 bacterium]